MPRVNNNFEPFELVWEVEETRNGAATERKLKSDQWPLSYSHPVVLFLLATAKRNSLVKPVSSLEHNI